MYDNVCGNLCEGWECSLPPSHVGEHRAYGGHELIPGEFCTSWLNDVDAVSDEDVAAAIASIKAVPARR
jgi:hypothetical protein